MWITVSGGKASGDRAGDRWEEARSDEKGLDNLFSRYALTGLEIGFGIWRVSLRIGSLSFVR